MDKTPEERAAKIAKLPAWARDYISQLEGLTRTLHAQLTEAQKDTTRAIGAAQPVPASGLPEGVKLPAEDDGYRVVEVLDGTADMKPLLVLPDRAEIRFAGWFQVHYGATEGTAGARVLIVEGDGDLIIRPAGRTSVEITRG